MLSKDHLENIQESKEKVVKHLIIFKGNFTSSIQTDAVLTEGVRVPDHARPTIFNYLTYLCFYLSIYTQTGAALAECLRVPEHPGPAAPRPALAQLPALLLRPAPLRRWLDISTFYTI